MKRCLFAKVKILLTCLFLFAGMEKAYAQINVDPAEYYGTGADITELEWDSNNQTTGRILLYNVGKDMFLNAGGYWGTRTATFTVGLPLILIKSADGKTYNIRGPFSNKDIGNKLGVVENAGGGDRGVYYDRGLTTDAVNWTFELYSSETDANGETDCTYRIWVRKTENSSSSIKNDYMLVANQEMAVNVFKGGNQNLVKALTESDVKEAEYSLWKIVTTDRMIEDFKTTYDHKHPSDATFLLRAQNFNRMNMYNEVKDGQGWHKSGNFDYKCSIDHEGIDNRYGMFYCGGITNSSDNKGKKGDKLYQTVEITQSGWYRVDCQGFFFNSENRNKCIARLYAKKDGAEENSAGNAYMNLLPKSYAEPYSGEEVVINDDNKDFIIKDNIVTNKVEAGILFYQQLYPNHLLVYVNWDTGKEKSATLELGIEIAEDMHADDYVYFDDFQLRYLGESFALDEGNTDFHHDLGDDDAVYKNRVMIFKRTYKNDTWNSITLPVNLTKEQLNTAFFPNPKLAKLIESDYPETIAFQMIDLSSLKDYDVALRKGECYLIKPGYAGRTDKGSIDIGDGKNTTITAPYYTIDRVSLTKKDVEQDLGITAPHTVGKFIDTKDLYGNGRTQDYYSIVGNDCKLRVYGTFQKLTGDNCVPAKAYTFVNGTLYHLTSPYAQKGFSCWIEDEHQIYGESHPLTFTTYIGGISDNTTSIEGFTSDITERELPQAVYSLQGQAVRRGTASLEGLPRGLYIVNGRKVAVRE